MKVIQPAFLDVMLICRYRILFMTYSRYENHISPEIQDLGLRGRRAVCAKMRI